MKRINWPVLLAMWFCDLVLAIGLLVYFGPALWLIVLAPLGGVIGAVFGVSGHFVLRYHYAKKEAA